MIPFAVAALGIATFSAMDAVMKGLTLVIGAYNAVLWRNVIGIGVSALPYAATRPGRPGRVAIRLHLARGALSAAMAVAFFWGLARMPLAEAIALSFVAPIIALYLAALLLGEEVERRAWIASLLGLAGVCLILSTRIDGRNGPSLEGAAAILGSAVLYAYTIVLMRKQALVAGPQEVTFFQNLTAAAALAVFAPWQATVPALEHVPVLVIAAMLASASLLLLAWAYRRAQAKQLASVEYTALIWAALFDILIFGEEIRPTTILGAGLIVAGCLLVARKGQIASPVEAAP